MNTIKPAVSTRWGLLQLTRGETHQEFVCGCCKKPKKSKVVVRWTPLRGARRIICNGCYGTLVSNSPGAIGRAADEAMKEAS
jgi:hypothetical protein